MLFFGFFARNQKGAPTPGLLRGAVFDLGPLSLLVGYGGTGLGGRSGVFFTFTGTPTFLGNVTRHHHSLV